MSEAMVISDSIKCGICSEACKRGVKVPCCSAIACRACATKSVTRNKICWNKECAAEIRTGDLINDEALREAVDKFQTAKKEAEAKKKAELEDKPEVEVVQAENDSKEEQLNKKPPE